MRVSIEWSGWAWVWGALARVQKDQNLLGASTAGMLDDVEGGIWEERARIYGASC